MAFFSYLALFFPSDRRKALCASFYYNLLIYNKFFNKKV